MVKTLNKLRRFRNVLKETKNIYKNHTVSVAFNSEKIEAFLLGWKKGKIPFPQLLSTSYWKF
jgi:hypothetical protein